MTETSPTTAIRVDYTLTAEQMAHALLSGLFPEDGGPHLLSPKTTISTVEKLSRASIKNWVRSWVQQNGPLSARWIGALAADNDWTEEEMDEVHRAVLAHIERRFPELIVWKTYERHPASGLTVEQYPFHDPRWVRVASYLPDATYVVHTTTSNVDAGYRLYGKLFQDYMDQHTEN